MRKILRAAKKILPEWNAAPREPETQPVVARFTPFTTASGLMAKKSAIVL